MQAAVKVKERRGTRFDSDYPRPAGGDKYILLRAVAASIEANPSRHSPTAFLGATVLALSGDSVGHGQAVCRHGGGVEVSFEVSAAPSALPTLLKSVHPRTGSRDVANKVVLFLKGVSVND